MRGDLRPDDPVASVRSRARRAAAAVDTRDQSDRESAEMEYRIQKLEDQMDVLKDEVEDSRRKGNTE